LDVDAANEQGLPSSVVERRKRKSKMFCTKGYFEFICFLESIFLANLTLEMMLAYADGDLVYEIKQQTRRTMRPFQCLWSYATMMIHSATRILER